jgi:uncharacterized protein (DUF983 family)
MIEDIDEGQPVPKCSVCGGYGFNFNGVNKTAQRCPACGGDKRSRNPKDYPKK